MNRKRKRSRFASLFVLTPAMLDCFAIPLLVLASQTQHSYDRVPAVVRENETGQQETIEEPSLLELAVGQLPLLDKKPVAWEQLPVVIKQTNPSKKIFVLVHMQKDGVGPVGDVLRLSVMAHEHNLTGRVRFISKQQQKESDVEAK